MLNAVQNILDKAKVFAQKGQLDQALHILLGYTQTNEPHLWVSSEIVEYCRKAGDYQRAIMFQTNLLDSFSEGMPPGKMKQEQRRLADCYLRYGLQIRETDFEARTNAYETALELYQKNKDEEDKFKSAFILCALKDSAYDAGIVCSPQMPLGKCLSKRSLANIIKNLETKVEKREQEFKEAKQEKEQNRIVQILKGLIGDIYTRDPRKALNVINKTSQKIAISDPTFYAQAASYASSQDEHALALIYSEKGLRHAPQNVALLTGKIQSLLHLGRILEGQTIAEKAQRIYPSNPDIASIYALGLCLNGRKRQAKSAIFPFLKSIRSAGMKAVPHAPLFVALDMALSENGQTTSLSNLFQNQAQEQRIRKLAQECRPPLRSKATSKKRDNFGIEKIWRQIQDAEGTVSTDASRATGVPVSAFKNPYWKPPGPNE